MYFWATKALSNTAIIMIGVEGGGSGQDPDCTACLRRRREGGGVRPLGPGGPEWLVLVVAEGSDRVMCLPLQGSHPMMAPSRYNSRTHRCRE